MFTDEQLGNPEAKIWIVSAYPKKGDTTPMSMQNSAWFMKYLYAQGLTIKDVRFDYLVNKVPARGGLETFWASGELDPAVQELKSRIETYKPNLVLGLGSEVLGAFFKQREVMKWRGHPMQLECGTKCIITFDPVSAHRQRFVDNRQKPGQYAVLMRQDIRKAVKEMQYPDTRFDATPVHICTNFGDTIDRLQTMLDTAHYVSFDIEVIEPYDGRLMDCLSLACEDGIGLCIPLWRPTGVKKDRSTWGVDRVWKNLPEFIDVFRLVKQIMESNIPKVAQNSQYDITTMEYYYGITVNNMVWDTMVAAHTMFCDLPKDLGTLIAMYTNIPYHKYLINSPKLVDRWEYSGADGIANLHVMSGQRKEMCDIDGVDPSCKGGFKECLMCPKVHKSTFYKHYRQSINPNIRHIVDMHKEGVRMDTELRTQILDTEHEYQQAILRALHKAIPIRIAGPSSKQEYNMNPKSPDQMKKLFYDLLKCKPVYVKGKPKMNDDARALIRKRDPRSYVHKLLDACEAYIYSDSSLLKFKVELDDGHIRTLYKPEGTDTGRFASVASDVLPAGTNLQNIEKGNQRASLVPEEEDEEFLHADLYAAEAFLNFLDSGELDGLKRISGLLPEQAGMYETTMLGDIRVMTKEVSDELKIHNWLGMVIEKQFPEECKKANLQYKDAKQLIHSMNYNVQPPMMAQESGLPLRVCEWVFHMYHRKFPGIQERMERIQQELRNGRRLNTAVGRRRYFFAELNKDLYNVAYAWPNQSCIGEVTNGAMVSCRYWSNLYGNVLNKSVLNTHDGIVNRIKKGTRPQAIEQTLRAFNRRLTLRGLDITIPVSIGFGDNFNDNRDEKVYFYPLKV